MELSNGKFLEMIIAEELRKKGDKQNVIHTKKI